MVILHGFKMKVVIFLSKSWIKIEKQAHKDRHLGNLGYLFDEFLSNYSYMCYLEPLLCLLNPKHTSWFMKTLYVFSHECVYEAVQDFSSQGYTTQSLQQNQELQGTINFNSYYCRDNCRAHNKKPIPKINLIFLCEELSFL